MRWVTRERPKTDRIACHWLTVTFIAGSLAAPFVIAGALIPAYDLSLSCAVQGSGRLDRLREFRIIQARLHLGEAAP